MEVSRRNFAWLLLSLSCLTCTTSAWRFSEQKQVGTSFIRDLFQGLGRRPAGRYYSDAAQQDLIEELPGLGKPDSRLFSGYVTVDEDAERALFYAFVESSGSPEKDPLVLWLNGGPGCSSLAGGFLSELGPYYPTPGGKLQRNQYTWTSVANIIFLESPAFVGWSYSNTTSDRVVGDKRTAQDARQFLLGFLERFPEFKGHPFWVSGESYGGHYVPNLAWEIVQGNRQDDASPINLQGFLVGNAWTDPDIDNEGAVDFWYHHAIISGTTQGAFKKACNFSHIGPLLAADDDAALSVDPQECRAILEASQKEFGEINIYDVYVDVCRPRAMRDEIEQMARVVTGHPAVLGAHLVPPVKPEYDPCIDNEVSVYFNRPDVQEAMHANVTNLPWPWSGCSRIVEYSQKDLFTSMLPRYAELLQEDLDILVFSGDVDGIVPVTGSRRWIEKLGVDIEKPWRPWHSKTGQVAGHVVEHDDKFTFATVRDAGHMVPYTQAAALAVRADGGVLQFGSPAGTQRTISGQGYRIQGGATFESASFESQQSGGGGSSQLALGEQVVMIKRAVEELLGGIQACTTAAQERQAGRGSLEFVQNCLRACHVKAEACTQWSEGIESMLSSNLDAALLDSLLTTNDALNSALQRWQALVSLDIADIGSKGLLDASSLPDSQFPSMDFASAARCAEDRLRLVSLIREFTKITHRRATVQAYATSNFQVRELREDVRALQQQLAGSEAAYKAALETSSSQYAQEIMAIKAAAVEKVKALLAQITDIQISRDELRERLRMAAADTHTDHAEAADEETHAISKHADEELAAARREVQRLRAEVAALEGALEEAEARHRAAIAKAIAETAQERTQALELQRRFDNLQRTAAQAEEWKAAAEEATAALPLLKLELKRESLLRKKADNRVRESKGNIRVLARVRPAVIAAQPGTALPKLALHVEDEFTLELSTDAQSVSGAHSSSKRFEFDTCFPPTCTQADVYEETHDLIQAAFDGYNVCIFCYGQTASGKTFTLLGEEGERAGIAPRAMQDVFKAQGEVTVSCSMLELYQDSLLDLLGNEGGPKLVIKRDLSGSVKVEGAVAREARTAAELCNSFGAGLSRRSTASTLMNVESSRSHLVLILQLRVIDRIRGTTTHSKLTFCDLAGSERVARSGSIHDAERFKEAKAINKSLSALGDVVAALTSGASHVPYRNHPLSHLLSDCLGGNAKTLLIVNVSLLAADAAETKNSLEYASRVKQVKNEASRSHETREMTRLRKIVESQAAELAQYRR